MIKDKTTSLYLVMLLLAFLLSACQFRPIEPRGAMSSPLAETTTLPFDCPITPVQTDFWDGAGSVAGEYPVWIASRGKTSWSAGGPKVYSSNEVPINFPHGYGIRPKTLIFLDSKVEGDLTVSGRRLDIDGLVYFPVSTDLDSVINTNGSQLRAMPATSFTIPAAHNLSRHPNPPGIAHHGFGPLYPNPGCYELTATIQEHEVRIVVEITD